MYNTSSLMADSGQYKTDSNIPMSFYQPQLTRPIMNHGMPYHMTSSAYSNMSIDTGMDSMSAMTQPQDLRMAHGMDTKLIDLSNGNGDVKPITCSPMSYPNINSDIAAMVNGSHGNCTPNTLDHNVNGNGHSKHSSTDSNYDSDNSDTSSTNTSTSKDSSKNRDGFKIPPKKRPNNVPAEKKDGIYWDKRRKNNESAKRSRDSRRMKEDHISMRVVYLEQENLQLRTEVSILKGEIEKLRCMLYNT